MVLFASVPGHCLPFTFLSNQTSDFLGVCVFEDKIYDGHV